MSSSSILGYIFGNCFHNPPNFLLPFLPSPHPPAPPQHEETESLLSPPPPTPSSTYYNEEELDAQIDALSFLDNQLKLDEIEQDAMEEELFNEELKKTMEEENLEVGVDASMTLKKIESEISRDIENYNFMD